MKISTKGRYGTRMLIELANHWGKGPMQLKDIAKNQQISLNYIEHLLSPLVASGLVRTSRGVSGGVWLAKPPEDIRVSEVFALFEGSTAPVECVDNPKICQRSGFCVTRDMWSELKNATDKILKSTTILDLVERQRAKGHTAEPMYYI